MQVKEALTGIETVYNDNDIERGRRLFAQECNFLLGTDSLQQLPQPSLPEVAFVGRSNVGKSSLVNALTGRKTLARTSNTPGRMQQLNFFNLGGQLILVDLPGYGYAKAPKKQVFAWTKTLKAFLRGRVPLRRICLLIDARHGLKDVDREMMDLMDGAAVVYQIVMTKIDKAKHQVLSDVIIATQKELLTRPAAYPILFRTSSLDKLGLLDLRANLTELTL